MLAKTGLLIVSNPMQISRVLSCAKKEVKNTLYIQLLAALSEPAGPFYPAIFNSWPKFSHTISKIYTQAASECENLDVRVLLSGLKDPNLKTINTQKPIDLVIFDKKYNESEIDYFMRSRVSNLNNKYQIVTIDTGAFVEPVIGNCLCNKLYKHTVLGGTFDILHCAHKLLLSEASLRSNERITVGVTEENMLTSKTLWELIEPIEVRVNSVKEFLKDICPELVTNVVPISDPFGPTQHDPSMELLVVSSETMKGGLKVNEVRTGKGLQPLDVLSVELIDEPFPNLHEEAKISSSTGRMRLLGSLLKPVEYDKGLPIKPYIIGLTGGICSGKSGIAKKLVELGAELIDCDLIGHGIYKKGRPCYDSLIKEFGRDIIGEDGEVDRKKLGALVFKDPESLNKLNGLVWPAMANDVKDIIQNSKAKVVIVDAAVLLTAGWQHMCHEVWTAIVPQEEQITRMQDRNFTKEQALARINAQPNNKFYVSQSNVVFCSQWEVEYTRAQVEKAWKLLMARLPSSSL